MTNPAVDAINAIKVPKGWKASEQLIDLFRQRAAAGTQIEAEDLDLTHLHSAGGVEGSRFKRDPPEFLEVGQVSADQLQHVLVLDAGPVGDPHGRGGRHAVGDLDDGAGLFQRVEAGHQATPRFPLGEVTSTWAAKRLPVGALSAASMRLAVSGETVLRALFPVDRRNAMVATEHFASDARLSLVAPRNFMYWRNACLLMSRTQSLPVSM